jgi:hypothetical protein
MHTADTGKTLAVLGGVQEIHAFGFGKAAPGANVPTLYLIGVVDGLRGIFRSDDGARNWSGSTTTSTSGDGSRT